jgi:hypothetical protein
MGLIFNLLIGFFDNILSHSQDKSLFIYKNPIAGIFKSPLILNFFDKMCNVNFQNFSQGDVKNE